MFDAHASSLLDALPPIEGLDVDEARRTLSAAYFLSVARRLSDSSLPAGSRNLSEVRRQLRRLANSLERFVLASFTHGRAREAAAFVSAESVSLLSSLITEHMLDVDPLENEAVYTALESGLLYMVAGYDVDAAAMAREADRALHGRVAAMGTGDLVSEVISLCAGAPSIDPLQPVRVDFVHDDFIEATRAEIGHLIAQCVRQYRMWLCGHASDSVSEVTQRLEDIRNSLVEASSPNQAEEGALSTGGLEFADLHHIAGLLVAAISATSERAAIASVPVPDEDEEYAGHFRTYLMKRCLGSRAMKGRPFVWPSAKQYIDECILGSQSNAVVSMPTGSGKSHLAEIAIVQALSRGWVLYLAPTNALVSQIRRDLSQALAPLEGVEVTAFLGREEYSPLVGVEFRPTERSVRVMTPEKASLFLRLYPEAYVSCSLCLLDECHLLGDTSRGPVVDALMAHIATLNDMCRFLLMSAMLSNARQLSEWISNLRDDGAIPLVSGWRPSRTMRGLVALDQESVALQAEKAIEFFRTNRSRKNLELPIPLVVVIGLSGPWGEDHARDYMTLRLPQTYSLQYKKAGNTGSPSWKNQAGRELAETLARSGLPAINFILASKHHAFASAAAVSGDYSSRRAPAKLPALEEAMLVLAEAELGTTSALRGLLERGVAVHTAAMLPMERQASESMFSDGLAPLMFATGTLAQGLNLPAEAIIVSGTSIGDPTEDVDPQSRKARATSTILNSFGRAGRPGFANHGLALLVTDHPYQAPVTAELSPISATERYPVMAQEDASVDVHSPLEQLIDAILSGEDFTKSDNPERDQYLVLLSESDARSSRVLRHTFGAFHRRDQLTDEVLEALDEAVAQGRKRVVEDLGAPALVIDAAIRSGITVERAANMWIAYKRAMARTQKAALDNVTDWTRLFLATVRAMPLSQMTGYVPSEPRKKKTFQDQLHDAAALLTEKPIAATRLWARAWKDCEQLLLAYMRGDDYVALASSYLDIQTPIDLRRSAGAQPIPKTLDLTASFFYRLSVDAGCFVALFEADELQPGEEIPEPLAVMPQAIRIGCDSALTLAWFTQTLQVRLAAHSLARRFPIPDESNTPSLRAAWISRTLNEWTKKGVLESDPLLVSLQTLLTQQRS